MTQPTANAITGSTIRSKIRNGVNKSSQHLTLVFRKPRYRFGKTNNTITMSKSLFFIPYSSNPLINTSSIFIAASLILVPGPNTATAPLSKRYW
jgi:hypothetical protein